MSQTRAIDTSREGEEKKQNRSKENQISSTNAVMPGRLQDRIAIITGSASGIGRAIALRYAAEGAKVVCADLTESTWRADSPEDEGRDPTHARIKASGGEAIFIKCDVTSPESLESLVKQTVEQYGRLDIMVNNAGIAPESGKPAPIWEVDLDNYRATMRVNVDGVYYGTRAAAAQMVSQEPLNERGDRGWILNACSVYGLVAPSYASAYATSKGAVANLTRAAAMDCAPYGVHVNAVNPGYVKSHLTDALFRSEDPRFKAKAEQIEAAHPLYGVGGPEDVAGVYVFLASEDARWMTGVSCKAFLHPLLSACNWMDLRVNFVHCVGQSSRRRWFHSPVTRQRTQNTFKYTIASDSSANLLRLTKAAIKWSRCVLKPFVHFSYRRYNFHSTYPHYTRSNHSCSILPLPVPSSSCGSSASPCIKPST